MVGGIGVFKVISMQGGQSGREVFIIGKGGKRQDRQESYDFWTCRPQ